MTIEIKRNDSSRPNQIQWARPWFVISVFTILTIAPALLQLVRTDGPSFDNYGGARTPTWRDLSKPAQFSRLLEGYVNGHFALRDQLIHLNNLIRYRIGVSGSQQVVIGAKNWLFYTHDRIIEQHTGQDIFTPGQLDQWVARFEAIRASLARRNTPMIMMIAPEKNTIYPEMLPQFPKPPGTITRADQIAQRLKGTNIVFVDPRISIMAEKKDHPGLYFQADTHWGHRAAFVAYTLLAKELARQFPNFKPAKLGEYEAIDTVVPSDLAYLLGLQNDIIVRGEVLKRKVAGPHEGVDIRQPSAKSGWGWPISFHKTLLADAPQALIFGDSFTDYILGPAFLYETVKNPIFTHHNNLTLNFSLVDEVKPDVVIVIIAERYLHVFPGIAPSP